MLTVVYKFLWDETAFLRYARALLFLAGELVRQGVIPTGIDAGGKYGVLLEATAFLFAAGAKTRRPAAV